MVWRNSATKKSHNSTGEDVRILEILNSDLPGPSMLQTVPFLTSEDRSVIQKLGVQAQTRLVDEIDLAHPTLSPQNAKFIKALGTLCSEILRLPTSAVISSGLCACGDGPVASYGFTDTWRARFNGKPVAMKALRIPSAQYLKEAKKILWENVPHWRRLSHPNILPFHGVDMTLHQLSLVYDWGEYGNISQYLTSHPNASRPSLLLDVAEGIEYLHEMGLTHGDIQGKNVIIDQARRARLTDYGLAPIFSRPDFTADATTDSVANSRWLAPEIIDPFRKGKTMPVMESKAADVFAFAIVATEVFTGKVPFEELAIEKVGIYIWEGGRPEIPKDARNLGFTGDMGELLKYCWCQNPKKRPPMKEVVRRFRGFVDGNTITDEAPPPARRSAGSSQFKEDSNILRLPREMVADQPERKLGIFRLGKTDEAVNFLGSKFRVARQNPKPEASQQDGMSGDFLPPKPPATRRKPMRGRVMLCGLW